MSISTRTAGGLSIVALMLAAATSPAQNMTLSWFTIDGGGTTFSTAGAFSLGGTIAQHDAGRLIGGAFELAGGFWAVSSVCPCQGDLNGDGQRNGRDIQAFAACMIAGGACACTDLDGDGQPVPSDTTDDLTAFVQQLLSDPASPCP
jgi:hypothetical protein